MDNVPTFAMINSFSIVAIADLKIEGFNNPASFHASILISKSSFSQKEI